MDHEFRRNTLDDSFHADFSMGHEALGRWLVDELGTKSEAIEEVIEKLEMVMVQGGEWQRSGAEFHLHLTQEEALIKANGLFDEEQEMPEQDFHPYEEESVSVCGLEDLLEVLLAWQDFLHRYGR